MEKTSVQTGEENTSSELEKRPKWLKRPRSL